MARLAPGAVDAGKYGGAEIVNLDALPTPPVKLHLLHVPDRRSIGKDIKGWPWRRSENLVSRCDDNDDPNYE